MALGMSQHIFCWEGVRPGISRHTRQEMLSGLAALVSTPESSAAVMIWNAMNHTALLDGGGGREGVGGGEKTSSMVVYWSSYPNEFHATF